MAMSAATAKRIGCAAQLLALAFVLLLFANGKFSVAVLAWAAPVFLLRFTRTIKAWIGLPLAIAVIAGAWLVQFDAMVPVEGAALYVIALATAIVAALPFALDKGLGRKLPGFAATLLFPCASVAVEYLNLVSSPYGSWGATAYTQYGILPLMQSVSVLGLTGLAFLLAWFAAVANWAWENGFVWSRVRQGVFGFAGVVLAVFLAGEASLMLNAPDSRTVRAAGIVVDPAKLFSNNAAGERFYAGKPLTPEELAFTREAMQRSNNALLQKTEREAAAGAKLIVWNEVAGMAFAQDEPVLLAKAAAIAKKHRAVLVLGVLRYSPGKAKPMHNKAVLIGPGGEVRFTFYKARPVPGIETPLLEKSGSALQVADTPYGRIGAVICFDMDFPQVVRQAGQQRVDILVAPVNEWRAIVPWHGRMSVFRAVENGVSLLRVARNGLSLGADYQGRVLAESDMLYSPDRDLVAYLPVRGVRTVYARSGDAFAWLCLAGLVLLMGAAFVRRR
jgi:apolipoprotein N-acyltransferase